MEKESKYRFLGEIKDGNIYGEMFGERRRELEIAYQLKRIADSLEKTK